MPRMTFIRLSSPIRVHIKDQFLKRLLYLYIDRRWGSEKQTFGLVHWINKVQREIWKLRLTRYLLCQTELFLAIEHKWA